MSVSHQNKLPILYLRSSLRANIEFCEMQAYLNYILGINREAGLKAELGTTTHAVLECLALAKLEYQNSKADTVTIKHAAIGQLEINKKDWFEKTELTPEEIVLINLGRINKDVYRYDCSIKNGTIYRGQTLVNKLINLCSNYYSNKSKYKWAPADFKKVKNWVWIVLEYNNGMYDPRNQEILQPEQNFDFLIEEEWAKYSYKLPNGKILDGQLAIKGTIDLTIIDRAYDIIEVIDYKTGQRKDWATGEIKDYKKLQQDKQLMLYYYAIHRLYPWAKSIILTIFFIRDGGPFSICFEPHQLKDIEQDIKNTFERIQNWNVPKMCDPYQKDFKCTKLCDYYKMQLDGTNFCKAINERLKTQGQEQVMKDFMRIENLGKYSAPGE